MPTDRVIGLAHPRRPLLRLVQWALVVTLAGLMALGSVASVAGAEPPVAPTATTVASINQRAERVIAAARAYLGVPYRVGTEGPDLFDCSGLVFRAFADVGEQGRIGGTRLRAAGYLRWFAGRGLLSTDLEQAERGDLVIYGNGGHIGIYLGEGLVISALTTGVTVHSIDGITAVPTGILAVNWTGKRGPFRPISWPLAPVIEELERPVALVPTLPWAPAPPAEEIYAGPSPDGIERVDMRTANSRTFEGTDGRLTTELFARPIFYQPPDATDWQPIDLSFRATEGSRSALAANSPARVELRPANARRGFLSLVAADRTLSVRLPAGTAGTPAAAPQVSEDGLYADYRDMLGDSVGMRVFARGDGFKAFLVVPERPGSTRFAFELETAGLAPLAEQDGSISLRDAAGTVVGRITRPLLLDSSDIDGDGGGVYSAGASLSLDTTRRRPRVTINLDRTRLEEAVYPVYADLTVVDFGASSMGTAHAFVSSGHPDTNFSAYQRPELPAYYELWHGRQPGSRHENVAFLRFGTLAQTLAGADIESARLSAFPYWQFDHRRARETWIETIADDWDARSLSWNARPTQADQVGEFPTVQGDWTDIDLTAYVRDVIAGAAPDHGLAIHAEGSGRDHWKRFVAQSGAGVGALEPRLVVVWSGLAPRASAADRSARDMKLEWTNPALAPAPSRFEIQLSTDSFASLVGGSGIVKGEAAAATSWSVPNELLTSGRRYSWRIRVKYTDESAWSDWSAPQAFSYFDRARLGYGGAGELIAER